MDEVFMLIGSRVAKKKSTTVMDQLSKHSTPQLHQTYPELNDFESQPPFMHSLDMSSRGAIEEEITMIDHQISELKSRRKVLIVNMNGPTKSKEYGAQHDNQNEVIYEGQWLDNRYSGRGRLHNRNVKLILPDIDFLENVDCMKLSQKNVSCWTLYEGDFKDGVFEGLGILYIQSNLKFHGSFVDGDANGRGTLVHTQRYRNFYMTSKKLQLVGNFEGGYIKRILYQ